MDIVLHKSLHSAAVNEAQLAFLRQSIRTIADYPKPGIQFRDITTLLRDAKAFELTVDALIEPWRDQKVDKVAGIEARGFILGGAVAHGLKCGFVPIRKRGKLPHETVRVAYSLEYGVDEMEMHTDAIRAGERVLLIDDLIATGGTATGAASLLQSAGCAGLCGLLRHRPSGARWRCAPAHRRHFGAVAAHVLKWCGTMSARTFVLIAGAWHGAWCWQKIVPLLEAQGHRVRIPDLPATGADTTDPAKVTLESWARFVAELLDAEPEPVILVGHSRGGVVISRAAEILPDKVRRLVYLCRLSAARRQHARRDRSRRSGVAGAAQHDSRGRWPHLQPARQRDPRRLVRSVFGCGLRACVDARCVPNR